MAAILDLERSVALATRRRGTVAWLLRRELGSAWEVKALAMRLGCDVRGILRLALCDRPDPRRFALDVAAMAAYLDLDAAPLSGLLRDAEAVAGPDRSP
jgi:hypothetical protein